MALLCMVVKFLREVENCRELLCSSIKVFEIGKLYGILDVLEVKFLRGHDNNMESSCSGSTDLERSRQQYGKKWEWKR